MLDSIKVQYCKPPETVIAASLKTAGIGPKVTQSVLTAAFLFAFKDVLYQMSLKVRKPTPIRA